VARTVSVGKYYHWPAAKATRGIPSRQETFEKGDLLTPTHCPDNMPTNNSSTGRGETAIGDVTADAKTLAKEDRRQQILNAALAVLPRRIRRGTIPA